MSVANCDAACLEMTEENKQYLAAGAGDPEATLVKPLFSEAAEVMARPVVPLEQRRRAAKVAALPLERRSWLVALILVSVLAGSVMGGFGLRLYQKHRRAAARAAAAETNTVQEIAPAGQAASDATQIAQPSTPPTGDAGQTATTTSTETNAPPSVSFEQAVEKNVQPDVADERPGDEHAAETKRSNEDPFAEARKPSAVRDDKSAERKKKERDDDTDARNTREDGDRAESRTRRVERNVEPRLPKTRRAARDEPYLVDSIVINRDRQPRQRRQRVETSRDRVRAIFEGQP